MNKECKMKSTEYAEINKRIKKMKIENKRKN